MSRPYSEIKDSTTREVVRELSERLDLIPLARGQFKFFELVAVGAVTARRRHNLGFRPKDVIVTSSIGAGVMTFAYASFTATDIVFTTTGTVTVRAFVGSYDENSGA